MMRRTRSVGLAVGWLFHLGLTLMPGVHVFDFSALVFCLYVAFLPPD